MELKPCDLILVHGDKNNFISREIEKITNSQYSHVAGYIGENTLIEAEGFEKTGQVPLSKYDEMYDVYRFEGLTNEKKDLILGFVNGQIGGRYDYFLLVIELFRYVFHKVLPYKEPFGSNICSQLWSKAFRSVGIDLTPNILYPSPKDISESKLLTKIN
jgi:uncharacterized protein YycO